jgi:hypothetical protein
MADQYVTVQCSCIRCLICGNCSPPVLSSKDVESTALKAGFIKFSYNKKSLLVCNDCYHNCIRKHFFPEADSVDPFPIESQGGPYR